MEPTSKSDSVRVLGELGPDVVHRNTFLTCLKRARDNNYRDQITAKCFDYSVATTGISLLLYDVSILYFEAEKEDGLRKVRYSKERRVDPQIVVGLLVDRTGFPLEIGCFEGNKAETHTIIAVIKRFQDRHQVSDRVVAADAGMLSAKNLTELDNAGLRFIVGSRQVKAPHDLAVLPANQRQPSGDDKHGLVDVEIPLNKGPQVRQCMCNPPIAATGEGNGEEQEVLRTETNAGKAMLALN
nr:IS1634 family transposase [Brevibacterium aurantiacum]